MMADPIHISYCVNRKVLEPLCVSIYSAVASVGKRRNVFVWVFHDDLTDSDSKQISEVVRPFGNACKLTVQRMDISAFTQLDGLHGEVIPFGKVLIPSLLEGKTERVVYLDADTVVVGGLDDLFDQDLEGRMIGAVSYETYGQALQAHFFKEEGLDLSEKTFNSGVMLVDVARWNAAGMTDVVVKFIRTNHSRYRGADQASLNLVFYRQFLPLRIRYNKRAGATRTLDAEDRRDGIFHFVGLPKPWDLSGRWANKNYQIYADMRTRSRVQPRSIPEVLRQEGILRSFKGIWKVMPFRM